jgi:hypothetical protein
MNRALSLTVAAFVVSLASAASAQEPTDFESRGQPVELRNQFSGKCLAVSRASTAHGATLIHKKCGTGDADTIWELAFDSGKGGYRIKNRNSAKCLGIAHQTRSDGALVTQVDGCEQRNDTTWQVETIGGVSLKALLPYGEPLVVRNRNSNKCLALVTGSEVKQYGCPPHRAKTTWQIVRPFTASAFKRVFVTSQTYQANFLTQAPNVFFWKVGRATADRLCQDAAAAKQLPGTYRAWLSLWGNPGEAGTSPVPQENVPTDCEGMRSSPLSGNASVPYVNVCDGVQVKIADNFADLLDGSLDHAISCTEDGTRFTGTPGVWTGTRTDGRQSHYEPCKQGVQHHGRSCYIADACWNYQVAGNYYLESPNVPLRRCSQEDQWWLSGENVDPVIQGDAPVLEGLGFTIPLRSLVGNASARDKNWTQYQWLSCYWKNAFRLYCFEQ